MKRGQPLQRRTPMKRGTSTLARAGFQRRAPSERAAIRKSRTTPPPRVALRTRSHYVPKAEREHMGKVAALGCILCSAPAHVHHIRTTAGAGQKASNYETIPLCPLHHQDGGYGVAYHAGPTAFEARFGTELELLALTRARLADAELLTVRGMVRAARMEDGAL